MTGLIPNRAPSVVGVRQAFDDTFGGFVPADWTLDAECTRADPAFFYPEKGGSRSKENKAIEVCGRCVVRQVCLDDALDFESSATAPGGRLKEVYGIRGGMTAKERRKIVNARKAEAKAKTKAAVIEAYADHSISIATIITEHQVASNTILEWAKAAGLPIRPRTGGIGSSRPAAKQVS